MADHKQPYRVVVASDFAKDRYVWNGMIYEMAALTAAFHGTAVVNATGRSVRNIILDRMLGSELPDPALPEDLGSNSYDLFFYVCSTPHSLTALKSLQSLRKRAKKRIIFIIETWSSKTKLNKRKMKLVNDFDHVFLFNEASVPAVQAQTTTPCSYLPAAVDALLACPYPHLPARQIDAFAMGRCEQPIHVHLQERARLDGLFYFFENFAALQIRSFFEARSRTYDLINRSKLFLCFNLESGIKAMEAKGEAALPFRIFEGIAAGSVLVGTAPRTKSFDALFDWEDVFIEASIDPREFYSSLAQILENGSRLQRAALRNMSQSLRKLDWVYRWEFVLKSIDLEITAEMAERKTKLAAIASLLEQDLHAMKIEVS